MDAGKAANKAPNPFGSPGKPDHQAGVEKLNIDYQKEAKQGQTVLREQKVRGVDSNRLPDSQIVNRKGRTVKVGEVERYPNRKRNREREEEYKKKGIPFETRKVE